MSLTSVNEYFTPGAREEVLELLEKYGDGAMIVAGGSFVHGLDARDLLLGIEALIDIRNVGLDQLSTGPDGLSMGAMVTFAQLQKNEAVQGSAAYGAVRDALAYPPLQIRNVATVGGNIASACPYFDLPTALMALDGVVRAQGASGTRDIGLGAFLSGMFENALESNEFVTNIEVPAPPRGSASAFIKYETNANDLAIVNVAVRITRDDAGTCRDARVAIGGGAAETPVRAEAAESLLEGRALTDESIEEAGAAVPEGLQPMSDHRASAKFRSSLAATLTRRALRRALDRLD